MGAAAKKLVGAGPDDKGWAHYEFGTLPNGFPGNCDACAARHRKMAGSNEAAAFIVRGLVPPPRSVPLRVVTPCRECPKHKLCPDNFGLHPGNELAARLYAEAARDRYVGAGLGGAFLEGTLTGDDARAVLDEFDDLIPTGLERQNLFRLMNAIDRVATRARRVAEQQAAEAAAKAAENRPRRSAH